MIEMNAFATYSSVYLSTLVFPKVFITTVSQCDIMGIQELY